MNPPHNPALADIGTLCATYLNAEEAFLAEALGMVRAVRARFAQTGRGAASQPKEAHQHLLTMVNDMKLRRKRFRVDAGRKLHCDPNLVTLSHVLKKLPETEREKIAPCAERVRTMIGELVTINYWLAVHLRIHLNAYQRPLLDLTGTSSASGRYGPEGKTEACEFRPVIQIKG